jgi:hypothetical protein
MKTCIKSLFLQPASLVVLAMMMATSLFGAAAKPPALTITAPKAGAKWSNEVYTVTGTVTKGTAAVANVFISDNAGGWSAAAISNTTWKAQIILTLGSNKIGAYAVDTNGLPSKTNTVTLTYIYAPPVLTITAPKTGAKWSNNVYTVTGTITPISAAVANVFVSDNAGGWSTANRSNANWTAAINLAAGTNKFAAYAVDTNGVPSKTNTVSLIYVLPLKLKIVGQGTVSPNYSNAMLVAGSHYTMKATAAKGFGFYFWDVGGNMTNGSTLGFTMESNLVITANFKDIAPPTITITAPKAGGKYTNSLIPVTGTASDNVGVTSVAVQINGGGWVSASGTTNWSAALSMSTGNNSVQAVAMDAAGNISKTNTVSFLGFAPPPPQQPYWAPLSLSNSLITLTSFTTHQMYLSCGGSKFSFADTNNNGDAGVGTYVYQATATNYGLAQLTFLNPPPASGNMPFLDFVFTDFNTGYYTNGLNLDTGTFSITINPARLLPTNWLGQKFTFHFGSGVSKLALTTTGSTFNLSLGSTPYFGTYQVTEESPVAAYLSFTSGNPTTGDTTVFLLQISYTAKGKGIYNVYEYVNGIYTRSYWGDFTSP